MTTFRYEWGKTQNHQKTKELGRPFYEDCIMARFVKAGGDTVIRADTTAFKETYLTIKYPGDRAHVETVEAMQRALERFKEEGQEKIEGTPITEWPMISVAEAENLRVGGILSIEALAELPDDKLKEKIVTRDLRNKAVEWLQYAADKGVAVSKAAEQSRMIEELKQENAELKNQVKALKTALDALQEDKGKKKAA